MEFSTHPRAIRYPEPLPVWHKVLQAYRSVGGSGLSANALVTLTGIPWAQLWPEMNRWYNAYNDLAIYRCSTVVADLFAYAICGSYQWDTERIEKHVKKFPPDTVASVNYGRAKANLSDMYRAHETLPLLMQVVKEHNEQVQAERLSEAVRAEAKSAE